MLSMGSGYGMSNIATCTCGANTYGVYSDTCFVNYCPLCGSYDSLYYGTKTVNEYTCSVCDADYCAYDGWDKSGQYRAQLTIYTPEPPKKVEKKVAPKKVTKLDIYKELVKQYNV